MPNYLKILRKPSFLLVIIYQIEFVSVEVAVSWVIFEWDIDRERFEGLFIRADFLHISHTDSVSLLEDGLPSVSERSSSKPSFTSGMQLSSMGPFSSKYFSDLRFNESIEINWLCFLLYLLFKNLVSEILHMKLVSPF